MTLSPPSTAVPPVLADQAAAGSTRIAEALRTPPLPPTDADRGPASPRWRGQSLSKGAAGVAILHGLRARAGLAPTEPVDAWLTAATREPLSAGRGAGLWYGAGAVAFALHETTSGRSLRAKQQLDQSVEKLVRSWLQEAHARIDAAVRPSLREYDLVRGLAGLGAHLLRGRPGDRLLRELLAYLVRLTDPVPARDEAGTSVPGWWTNDLPSGWNPGGCHDGHADLGAAHGITGPLALLSLAHRCGVTVEGQTAAIAKISDWLKTWCQDGPAGPWWPERLTLDEVRAGAPKRPGPNRPSWCYGTPGIARALQLAAIATDDQALQQLAERALDRCLTDPDQMARLTDPALCHGWAGVFTTTWYAATDARSPALASQLPHLLHALLDHATGGSEEPIGLIEGSAGVAMALHLAATGAGGWETCLLIN